MEQKDFTAAEPIRSATKEIDVKALLTAYELQKEENSGLKEENLDLKQQLAVLKKIVYGQKSEKTEYVLENSEQQNLFDEAEQEENRKDREAEKPIVVPTHTRKAKRTHEELAEYLPVEEVLDEVEERECDICGSAMEPIGREFIRDELIYVPARLFVRKHYAEVLKCTLCGTDESRDAKGKEIEGSVFKKAVVPAPMIPHSFCSPELLAHIAYEKYCNGMPLYRLEKDFAAKDVLLSRATMANWIIYAAKEWLRPLCDRMKDELLKSTVIHADETVVQVLHEPGKKAKTDSRMWVYCAGEIGCKSNILFEYQPTRNGDHASRFLQGFDGKLVCDGYDGYNKVKNVTRCGCFAHVRRKFVEALPLSKEELPDSKAAIGVDYCNRLFGLEEEYAKLTPTERHNQRQEQSKPVLDGFYAWLETVHPAGGTKLAKAVSYALSEKRYLYAFLEDPNVPISNNRAENAIRPFVVGRKQWLFSDSVKGAEASAIFYSIAATATANGVNVERYFTELFRTLPHRKRTDSVDAFLPSEFQCN